MDMLAARLYGKKDLRVERIPLPKINDDEVLVRVRAATICGTDLRMYLNGTPQACSDNPLVLCHEFAGDIEAVGANVTGYKPGLRVCVAPNIGCGLCDLCVAGNSHHCSELSAIGIHTDGGFAEFVRIPAGAVRLGNITPIGDNISYLAAATNEALSCAYNAFEFYGINPGETVVIIGAGAIGLMHAQMAKMAGAAKIILNDLSQERLAECAALAPYVITIKDNLRDNVMKETGGRGADVVITACSAASAQRDALTLAALNSRVNLFGALPKGKEVVPLDTNLIHYKQISLTGTTRASHAHYRKTLDLIASGLVDVDSLVTHKYPLADIEEAFKNAAGAVGLRHAIVF